MSLHVLATSLGAPLRAEVLRPDADPDAVGLRRRVRLDRRAPAERDLPAVARVRRVDAERREPSLRARRGIDLDHARRLGHEVGVVRVEQRLRRGRPRERKLRGRHGKLRPDVDALSAVQADDADAHAEVGAERDGIAVRRPDRADVVARYRRREVAAHDEDVLADDVGELRAVRRPRRCGVGVHVTCDEVSVRGVGADHVQALVRADICELLAVRRPRGLGRKGGIERRDRSADPDEHQEVAARVVVDHRGRLRPVRRVHQRVRRRRHCAVPGRRKRDDMGGSQCLRVGNPAVVGRPRRSYVRDRGAAAGRGCRGAGKQETPEDRNQCHGDPHARTVAPRCKRLVKPAPAAGGRRPAASES